MSVHLFVLLSHFVVCPLQSDGSALDFEPWCEECPRTGDYDDCVVTTPEGWFDVNCEEERHPFVCQVP